MHNAYFQCALKSCSSCVSVFYIALPGYKDVLSAILWVKGAENKIKLTTTTKRTLLFLFLFYGTEDQYC